MLKLIYESGPLFLGLITIIFLIILVTSFLNGRPIFNGNGQLLEVHRTRIGYIKSLGLLALVVGVFGQLIGLYSAFGAMSQLKGDISPEILLAGLKVSLIPTLYGMFVFIISHLIWLGLCWKLRTDID